MTMILLRLAGHYHRPDFTTEMANAVIRDMVMEDLAEFTVVDLETAIREYRQNPKNRFFPNSGQLRELAMAARSRNGGDANKPKLRTEWDPPRPLLWWLQSQRLWKPDWRIEDIPEHEREMDRKWRAKGHGQ